MKGELWGVYSEHFGEIITPHCTKNMQLTVPCEDKILFCEIKLDPCSTPASDNAISYYIGPCYENVLITP